MNSPRMSGIILISISALILGSNGIFARWVGLPAPVLLFYRYFFGVIILTLYLLLRNRNISPRLVFRKEILIIGLLNTLLSVTAYYSFTHTTIANAEILLYAYPVYMIVLAPLVLKEKIERSTVAIILFSFVGLILVVSSGGINLSGNNFLGLLSGFCAGIIFALYVLTAKLIGNKYGGMELNFFQLVVSVLILFPFLFLFQYQITFVKILLLILMGLLHGALALSLYFQGIKTVKAQNVGVISYLEPLSAIVYAMIIFGEIPGIFSVIGGALILFSGYRIISKQG